MHIKFTHIGMAYPKKPRAKLAAAAPMFRWGGTQLGRFASETGGMYMRVKGLDADKRPIRQTWNLIATDGDGPYIPTLAAEILILRWLKNQPVAGARPAVSEITLGEFEQVFDSLAISTAFSPVKSAPYLFARVLGDDFAALPIEIQNGHKVSNTKALQGRVDVVRGKNLLCQLVSAIVGFAKTGADQPIIVTMDVRDGQETWIRTISGRDFKSVLSCPVRAKPSEIYERFGPAKFLMGLHREQDTLHYDILSGAMFGIPLPKFLLPKSITHERVEDGKFVFDVEIRLPVLGKLVAYKGWLE